MTGFLNITSISQLHQMLGYAKPQHPLITVIDYSKITTRPEHYDVRVVVDFYIISLKSPSPKSVQYGRQYYDFEEGSIMCMAPGQVLSVQHVDEEPNYQGWGLYFHPDLIYNTALGKKIKDFTFFSYSVSEALHLSEEEKRTLSTIIKNMEKEISGNIDSYSQQVIAASIELLLTYCQRFYGRQFITRKKLNTDLVSRFENLLFDYFASDKPQETGLPTVEYFATELNLSASYLTDLLKKETGRSTKEHLQIHLIELAKLKLLNSNETVSEIAYGLGFNYPQYFNKLFKERTGITPAEYRNLN